MSKSIQYIFSTEKQHPIFQYIEAPENQLSDFDPEVDVLAISLNPVDYKVASNVKNAGSAPKILGWDVAGKILRVGDKVKGFAVGDEVYYAGDITKTGGNTQRHLVDSRIVAKKPTNLSFTEASALPLTTLTAWEFMFTRSMFQTDDMSKQSEILAHVAKLIENGKIKTTKNMNLGAITPENLKKGHDLLLTGNTVGKIVLDKLE